MLEYYRMPSVKAWWAERCTVFSPEFGHFLALEENKAIESR
jgi:hypothetical protein